MQSMRMPKFTLKILGGFQLFRSDVTVELPTRKLACLLAYLACTAPVPQSRDKLANLLWGRYEDERARHNLRQALSRLRQVLGSDEIVNVGDAVRLAQGGIVCDAVSFDQLIRVNDEASITAAAEIYDGALLEGITIADATWNEWLLQERDRLKELAIGAIVAHGESRLIAGDIELATRSGRRAVALDNFREDAHRLILKSLAAAGRHSEALRHFQDLAAFLKGELNAGPDKETSLLIAALARGRSPSGSANQNDEVPARSGSVRAMSAAQHSRGRPSTDMAAMLSSNAEPQHLTVLSCDISAGPSGPASSSRNEALSFRHMVTDLVERSGGRIVAGLGGAVHACFGYPEAHEQDAAQATRLGMAIVQSAQNLRTDDGEPIQARVGIASGLALVEGSSEPGALAVIGETSALALQLLDLASPGTIIVSRDTRLLLDRAFNLDRFAVTAPGAPEGWTLSGEKEETGSAGPLIGRQEEFDLLLRRWDQVQNGQGRVVLLSGEPGIGKSFMADHLLRALAGDEAVQLRYFCSPHHKMRPLHPYITQIERSAGLPLAGSASDRLDRLAASIRPISANAVRDVSLIGEFLELASDERYPRLQDAPPKKRELIMASFLEQLDILAGQRPVILLFEDLHWIDPTSLELLDRTIARIRLLPILLIATLRPEHQPAWVGQPHVTILHLSRLNRDDSTSMVRQVADGRAMSGPIVDQIVDRADGVPLIIKELSKHILEREMAGEDNSAAPVLLQSIPRKLQTILSARFDRLGPARKLALMGAAIGRRFSHDLIAAIADADFPDLNETLGQLIESGLLSRLGTPPHASYAFTHALVRDAAYDRIGLEQRRHLHSRIADILIDQFYEPTESSPDIIADHLVQAERHGEAVDYWVKAARLAHMRWANRECAGFFELALKSIEAMSRTPAALRQAVDVRFEMKNVLTPLGEFDKAIAHLREARGLIDQLGDPQRLCQFHVHMCQILGLTGKSHEAIAFGQDAETLAGSLGDRRLQVEAAIFLATAYFTVMQHRQAERLFQKVLLILGNDLQGQKFAVAGFPAITAAVFLTRIHAIRGDFDVGIGYGEQAVRDAENLQQPYGLSMALWCLADLHLTRGNIALAVDLFERGLAISHQADLPFLAAGHSGSLGYAYVLTSRTDEGLPLLEQAMRVFESMRHQFALSLFLVPLGEAYVIARQWDQAGELARRALQLALANGHPDGEPGALHILADIAARSDRLEEAEVQYRAALVRAEDLEMRPLMARCRYGLANVHLHRGELEKKDAELAAATMMFEAMGMPI